jgi:hypothetical protein
MIVLAFVEALQAIAIMLELWFGAIEGGGDDLPHLGHAAAAGDHRRAGAGPQSLCRRGGATAHRGALGLRGNGAGLGLRPQLLHYRLPGELGAGQSRGDPGADPDHRTVLLAFGRRVRNPRCAFRLRARSPSSRSRCW